MWELKLLGRFQLSGSLEPVALASAKVRALLAYLALLEPKGETREHLTSLLWGSHFEKQARQNLSQALTRLKKVIGSEAVLVDDHLVRLSPGSISTDVGKFKALMRGGSEADLREAVGLGRGRIHVRSRSPGGAMGGMAIGRTSTPCLAVGRCVGRIG